MEEFEASRGWLFFGHGGDKQYDDKVRKANELILTRQGFYLLDYNIFEPVELIAILSKVIS
jgi:hypothetical protein